jgi:hypothetical protein
MLRAAENRALHPQQRAPIDRTRMIRAAPYHQVAQSGEALEHRLLMDNAFQLVESFWGETGYPTPGRQAEAVGRS